MTEYLKDYWNLRLAEVKNVLEVNNFEVHLADNKTEAKDIVLNTIVPAANPKSISFGGSVTVTDSGLYDALKNNDAFEILDTYDKKISREEMVERRRQALLVDLFITGTNAVTDNGKLVNLDMIGNRVGALTFGPKHVVILAGRNKLVAEVDDALMRIKNYAAPANTMRLKKKNPCLKSGYCEECQSKERICNTWTIHDKSFPKGRIKIVLINEDLGL
ncbi:MAG: lactate utilization protein [Proteobacteria bacterium]|nr:lactate utilization protein [Pseudomonadota bacterium]